jgi:hypothetical protein
MRLINGHKEAQEGQVLAFVKPTEQYQRIQTVSGITSL